MPVRLMKSGSSKWGLLNASFTMEVLGLKTPVAWHRHRIPSGLEVDLQLRVLCCHLMPLHSTRLSHELLKFSHREAIHSAQLLLGQLRGLWLLFQFIIAAIIIAVLVLLSSKPFFLGAAEFSSLLSFSGSFSFSLLTSSVSLKASKILLKMKLGS